MHEARDPEYSILKQRLARRMRYEGTDEADVQKMDLVDLTKVRDSVLRHSLASRAQAAGMAQSARLAVAPSPRVCGPPTAAEAAAHSVSLSLCLLRRCCGSKSILMVSRW